MSSVPANSASLLVAISGVVQDPGTYSVSSTTLTFTTAPPSGTGNISVRYLGIASVGTVGSFSAGTTGLTPSSATTGAVVLAGTLNVANGGTGQTSLTANSVLLGNGTSGVQSVAPGTNGNLLTSNGTTWVSQAAPSGMVYPGAGIPNSTGSAWGTSYTTTGSGTVVALATSPTFVTPALGTPSSGVVTNLTGTASININGTVGATTPNTGAFTTVSATGGYTATSAAPFYLNATTVSANYTSPANYNLMSAGPITINTGVTVTIDTTGSWVIV
jgi:hypothetical protein